MLNAHHAAVCRISVDRPAVDGGDIDRVEPLPRWQPLSGEQQKASRPKRTVFLPEWSAVPHGHLQCQHLIWGGPGGEGHELKGREIRKELWVRGKYREKCRDKREREKREKDNRKMRNSGKTKDKWVGKRGKSKRENIGKEE